MFPMLRRKAVKFGFSELNVAVPSVRSLSVFCWLEIVTIIVEAISVAIKVV
jgi:hypothetical protein